MTKSNFKRDTYFLTKEERATIRRYILDNPNLFHRQVAEHFNIAISTVHNIKREAQNREHYEKEISRLTNQLNRAADNIFKLQNEILKLKRNECFPPEG